MTEPSLPPAEARGPRRLLWGLVIGVALLNVILFLVFSRSSSTGKTPAAGTTTNAPAAR